jgi:hypothetical protein
LGAQPAPREGAAGFQHQKHEIHKHPERARLNLLSHPFPSEVAGHYGLHPKGTG